MKPVIDHIRITVGILDAATLFHDKMMALRDVDVDRDSRAEVDRLYLELTAIGARIVGGPKLWPQHGPDDYAVFFKDPEGIKNVCQPAVNDETEHARACPDSPYALRLALCAGRRLPHGLRRGLRFVGP